MGTWLGWPRLCAGAPPQACCHHSGRGSAASQAAGHALPAKPPPWSGSTLSPGCAGPCEDVSGKIERYNTYFKIICWLDLFTVNVYLAARVLSLQGFPQALQSEACRKIGFCPHAPPPNCKATRSCTPKHTTNPVSSAPPGRPFSPGKPTQRSLGFSSCPQQKSEHSVSNA